MTKEEFNKFALKFLRNGFLQDKKYNLEHNKPSLYYPPRKKFYLSYDGYNLRVIKNSSELKCFTNQLTDDQITVITHFFRYTDTNKEHYEHLISTL